MKSIVAITGLNRGENPQPGAAVMKSLRREWPNIRLVGLAYDALESGVYAGESAGEYFLLPYLSVEPEMWLERIDTIRERVPFDVLIPTLDAEMEPLFGLRHVLAERGVKVVLPEETSFRQREKTHLTRLGAATHVAVPETRIASTLQDATREAQDLGYPVFVKGRFYDAWKVHGPSELMVRGGGLLAEWGGPLLVQESVEGDEFNVLGIGDGEGGLLASCAVRKMVVSSKGKGYGGITVNDPKLREVTKRIVQQLCWKGPFELELMKSRRNGDYYLIEMNPRFPAWADYPAALGCNMAAMVLKQTLGEPVKAHDPVEPGHFFVRHNEDIVCRVEDMGRMTAEGEILRENDER